MSPVGIQHDGRSRQHMEQRVEAGVRQEISQDCRRNDFPRRRRNWWNHLGNALGQVWPQENAFHLGWLPIIFR